MALIKDTHDITTCPINHIAFIMDGNGRWAKKRGMPREFGHKKGAETFKKIMEYCGEIGLKAATFYVFSTENWKRSEKEVSALMKLLDEYLDDCYQRLKRKERDVRFVFLGDKAPFTPSLRAKMEKIEEESKNNSRIVNLAINYGGRSELVHAYHTLIKEGKTDICEDDITHALYTKDSPELDMVIRTGGDLRISNFLLWQTAYAELYFTDKLWPDFDTADLDAAIDAFKSRQRRFGGV
jgi:undecaprenyl diphosphate synthase